MPTALVTGATEGIGRAVAFALGRAGYQVGVCARTPSKLRVLLEELRSAGLTAHGVTAYNEIAPLALAFQEAVLSGLTQQQRDLLLAALRTVRFKAQALTPAD